MSKSAQARKARRLALMMGKARWREGAEGAQFSRLTVYICKICLILVRKCFSFLRRFLRALGRFIKKSAPKCNCNKTFIWVDTDWGKHVSGGNTAM